MRSPKLFQLFLYLCCLLPLASCVTHRTAKVRIQNNTPTSISGVGLVHKYSDVYQETITWKTIPAGGYSSTFLIVNYNTGFLTTGRDWWQVSFHRPSDAIRRNSMMLWYSDPDNFRSFFDWLEQAAPSIISGALKVAGYLQPELKPEIEVANVVSKALCDAMLNSATTDGFKQHILRSEDEGQITTIRINNDGTINFLSPSGESDTVYHSKVQSLGL